MMGSSPNSSYASDVEEDFLSSDATEEQNQDPAEKQQPHNVLDEQFERQIRPCIDLIDSLRVHGVEKDLDLPTIAVIGDQSSGKSSVLEALSGVSLPRGSGIVTRCPLELKLIKSDGSGWDGRISYLDRKLILGNPEDVGEAVRKAQNIIAGDGKGISDELITLEIASSKVPDLTLIDLPGITRVALPDQPQDIEQQIKQIIFKYIKRQETIILVVVPSNVDIATTEALEMAKQVDPEGERTLGILTKPDLVDKGTESEVINVVRNQTYTLKKGYIIVRCRGQSEIASNITLDDATNTEKAFFENHRDFKALYHERKATIPVLAIKLTTELVEHIKRSIPNLQSQIGIKLQDAQEKLQKMGTEIPDTDKERLNFLVKKIKAFVDEVNEAAEGEEEVARRHRKLFNEIRRSFNSWEQILNTAVVSFPLEINGDPDIYENEHRGRELRGLNSFRTFERIVRKQVGKLEAPAVEKLNEISASVQAVFSNIASKHFKLLPNLHMSAKVKLQRISNTQYQEAEKAIKAQFKIERRVVYCQDIPYGGSLNQIRAKHFNPIPMDNSANEMSQHIEAYFSIVKDRLNNQIPLITQHYALFEVAEDFQAEMMALIHDKGNLDKLLEEEHDLGKVRKDLKDRIQRLQAAQRELARFHR